MDLSIHIAPDRLTAVLDLPAGKYVELATLKMLLQQGEIRSGLHREALVAATHADQNDRSLVLAEGEPPVPGSAGGLDPAPQSKPRPVKAGEVVGSWLPPVPGRAGMGVDGSPIAPTDPPPLRLGRGLSLREDGRVLAERDGELVLDPDGCLRVALAGGLSERERTDVAVVLDPKGLEARVSLGPGEYVSLPALEAALAKAGVVYGIDASALTIATRTESYPRPLVVARGTAPISGLDAHIELLIDDHLHFRVDDFDRADYHDVGKAHEVAPGSPLARLHPATAGTPGTNVRGQLLPARPGREQDLGALVGEGSRVSVTDPAVIEAEIVGVYHRTRQGKLQVHPLLTIAGDVDLKSGNIDTNLSVLIKGDVKAGFVVKSAADIQVMGVIEDARISARGSLTVHGGILAGRMRVKAHGNVIARYITGRDVKANDIEVAASIRYSRIYATGNVTAKEIIGGQMIAAGNVTCEMLGSSDEQRTQVQVGVNPFEEALFLTAQQMQEKLTIDTVRLKERCKVLAHKLSLRASQLPAGEEDPLAQDLSTALKEFSTACTRMAECEAVLGRHSEHLADKTRAAASAMVTVRTTAHLGVEVLVGELAKVELRENLAGPVFRYLEGAVTWA